MYYLGFDIGGTKCAVSLGKWDGQALELVAREEIPTRRDPEETLNALSPYVKTWLDQYDVKRAGVSCGGPLDSQAGVLGSVPNLSEEWHGFQIVSYIKKQFGLEARLENDANASAVAEWKFGAGQGADNMIFMTFGTGLGAGLVLNGRLYSGTNGNAGEVGHIRLEKNGPIGYRKEGSAEGFCSGAGICRLAKLRAQEQDVLLEENLSTKRIFELAKGGDAFCQSVLKESAEQFGKVISLLIDLFNPEVIVAGGVFMRNYAFFMSVMTPIIERESLGDSYRVCRILPAKIGENIGDYAALALAIMEEQ